MPTNYTRIFALIRQIALALFFLVITETAAFTAPTVPMPPANRLVIILVDTLDPLEIAADSAWTPLLAKGSYGLMNTRSASRVNAAVVHLTLGAGVRADAPADAGSAYNTSEVVNGEKVTDLYTAQNGRQLPTAGIALINLGRLLRLNAPPRTGAPIGWLGDQLQAAGVEVALVGNSDLWNEPRRNGALLVMNSEGIVPRGVVGKQILQRDTSFPYAWRTNYAAITKAVNNYADAGLLVVELGDLARLDAYRDTMTDAAWQMQRAQVVHQIGVYIQQLLSLPALQGRSVLMLSPTPRVDRLAAGYWLTPALLLQSGLQPGLLHSRGTRRPGVVLGIEMTTAIFHLATTHSADILRFTPHADSAGFLSQQYQRLITIHDARTPVLRSYVVYSISIFLAAWLVLWAIARWRLQHFWLWDYILLTVAAFPLAALLLPLLQPASVLVYLTLTAALTALIAALVLTLGHGRVETYFWLFGATTLALLIDVVRGAPLIQWSVLGYDVIGGARFYGIGNEYGGVLLASCIMSVGIMLQRWPKRFTAAIAALAFLFTAIVTGAPWWGANNGDAAAAILGFAFTAYFLTGRPITIRRLVFAGAALVFAAAIAVAADLLTFPENPSHLGMLARQVATSGFRPLFAIASRKLAMNWKLLKYTIWTKVLIVSLVASLGVLTRPTPWMRVIVENQAVLLAAARGALVTAMFLLLLNDSGVVAAATAMIPVTTVLLFLTSHGLQKEHSGKDPT